ncbi:MAG: outer membrane protein transport protein [Proteobacteria bacterium]|nr:outer membrane protein transport protein [Pseudomonadota bacterium]
MRTAVTGLALLLALPAHATVPDKYGPGARSRGMGGGGVALVEDGTAAYQNPAGLGRVRQPQAAIGIMAGKESLADIPPLWWDTNRDGVVDDRDTPLNVSADMDDPVGFNFHVGRQVGGKFGIGISGYMPAARLFRMATFEPDLPNYFMYTNRQQRYTLAAGVGGEIVRGVSIGASVDFVPQVVFAMNMTMDVTATSSQDAQGIDELLTEIRIDTHEMSLDVVPGFAPILGIQLEVGRWFEPLDGLVIGAMYRGSVGLPIDINLNIQANINAEDIGDLDPFIMAAVIDTGVSIYDHYVPAVASFGAAWRTDDTLTAYADLRWTNWKPLSENLNVAHIVNPTITSPLIDISDSVVDGNSFEAAFKSTVSVAAGTELKLPRQEFESRWKYAQIAVRGGFAYVPTPLVGQGESSALLDTNRLTFSLGAGLEFWDPLKLVDAPVRLDAFGQYHVLAKGAIPRSADTPTPGFPVEADAIPFGGNLYVLGGQIGFDY